MTSLSVMDLVLDLADEYLFDQFVPSAKNATFVEQIPLLNIYAFPRDDIYRQFSSLFIITLIFAYFFYFLFSGLSYYFVFDHELMKHPKYLENQIRKEIRLSVWGFPITTLVTVPWFLGEVRGYSKLYDDIDDYGWFYAIFSISFFLFFTDACIYWIHRWLHHPLIYKRLHKVSKSD